MHPINFQRVCFARKRLVGDQRNKRLQEETLINFQKRLSIVENYNNNGGGQNQSFAAV
jgi:hypothetical protein